MKYTFTIQGRLKPKERPRQGRGGHFYTPRATLASEEIVALRAKQGGLKAIVGPITIMADFCGNYGNCDLDNLIKTLLDGLKIFFKPKNTERYRILR